MKTLAWDWTELSAQVILTFGHFLWQGCLVGLALLTIERLLRIARRGEQGAASRDCGSANRRYNLACVAFFALPVCVAATFACIHSSRGSFLAGRHETAQRPLASDLELSPQSSRGVDTPAPLPLLKADAERRPVPAVSLANSDSLPARQTSTASSLALQPVRAKASYLLVAYVVGVVILLGRFSLSIVASSRLRTLVQPIADSALCAQIAIQADRLRLRRVPIVALCARVSAPMLVGIAKPMILLPPALLCGLDPTHFGAILAHEMAHIRRYDLLVNLAQRLVEALLFFHPVTWWLSRRVSIERENCCDDLAAACVGRLSYAEALLEMAALCLGQQRREHAALATLAADGGNASDLGYRIRRLINAGETPRIGLTRRGLATGLTLLAVLASSWVAWGQPPQPNPKTPLERTSADTTPAQAIADKQAALDRSFLDKDVQWSLWGDRDGLLSGARLILPQDGLQAGEPLVVEYQLANVSKETKTLRCYLPNGVQFASLGRDRIIRGDLDWQREPTKLTLQPGAIFVASEHRVSIDTSGLEPGDYQVALGSAFRYPNETNPQVTEEIPHRGRILFQIAGEPRVAIRPIANDEIQWGPPIAGLRLGARFVGDPEKNELGKTVEADLFVMNATDNTIVGSVLLPHPEDGWLFNLENDQGHTVLLQRPIPISYFAPQRFLPLELAPGAVRALTGETRDQAARESVERRVKFEIASAQIDERHWADRSVKGRLVTQGGKYSAIFEVTVARPEIPGLRLTLDSGHVWFTATGPDSTQWFARHTKMLAEMPEPPMLLILIDDRPLIAPRLQSPIPTGKLEISGRFTKADADSLAAKLRN